MDPKTLQDLHLDVRLQQRQGWIHSSDLDDALAALEDVSHKVAAAESESEKAPPAAAPVNPGSDGF